MPDSFLVRACLSQVSFPTDIELSLQQLAVNCEAVVIRITTSKPEVSVSTTSLEKVGLLPLSGGSPSSRLETFKDRRDLFMSGVDWRVDWGGQISLLSRREFKLPVNLIFDKQRDSHSSVHPLPFFFLNWACSPFFKAPWKATSLLVVLEYFPSGFISIKKADWLSGNCGNQIHLKKNKKKTCHWGLALQYGWL